MYNVISDVMSVVKELREEFPDYDVFTEAPGALAALPDPLKKIVANKWSGGMAGENSQITTIGTVSGKSFPELNRLLRKAILEVKNYLMVWVEMDNKVIAGVISDKYGNNTFNLFFPDGSAITKTDQKTVHGTGKWDRRLDKYVPAQYYNSQRRDLKSTEAQESLYSAVYGMYKNAQADYGNEVDNFLQSHSFVVRAISADMNRVAVAGARAQNKPASADAQQIALQQAALRRLVQQKLEPIVASITASLPTVDDIMNVIDARESNRNGGFKPIDTAALDHKIQQINQIIRAAQYAIGSNTNAVSRNFSTKRPELSWSIQNLLKALKEI
jgi:hypothetical protein